MDARESVGAMVGAMPGAAVASGAAPDAVPPVGGGIVPVGPAGAGALLAVMHGQGTGALDIPKPLSEPILIIPKTRVAGTSHVEDIDVICEGLAAGDRLTFVRERSNRYDEWCVRVMDARGRRVGFVSADVNQIPARLMDGGKQLFGKVLGVELVGRWYRVDMEVFLDD